MVVREGEHALLDGARQVEQVGIGEHYRKIDVEGCKTLPQGAVPVDQLLAGSAWVKVGIPLGHRNHDLVERI